MAILDEAKTALRLTTNDTALTAEVQRLIDEAVIDLTVSADIKAININSLDAYEKGAIITYVKWKWFEDDKYRAPYEDIKAKMALSYKYRDITIPQPPISPL